MKKRYTEEQIIKAIKQHEAGAKVDDICRDMGVSVGPNYPGCCILTTNSLKAAVCLTLS